MSCICLKNGRGGKAEMKFRDNMGCAARGNEHS